jgi:LuxR family transcriptional regulator
MAVGAIVQPHCEVGKPMTQRASIATMLHALDELSPAGCAIALHISFTSPKYMFQTYPKRWLDYYSSSGLVMHDPVAHWGLQNTGSIRWKDLAAIDPKGVLEQAKDFGLMNGVAISVFLSGSRSIAGFARADRDYLSDEIEEMEDVLAMLHRTTATPGPLRECDRRVLTELSIRLTH